MPTLTLSKSARLQQKIRAALATLPLEPQAAISIFSPDPAVELKSRAARLDEHIWTMERLLAILARLRGAAGKANGERGIAALLAEKAAREETIALLTKPLPRSGQMTRLFEMPFLARDKVALDEQLRAMRARYESADAGETIVTLGLLDETAVVAIEVKIVAARRRLEEIGERLRELNGSVLIEVDDEMLADLRAAAVI